MPALDTSAPCKLEHLLDVQLALLEWFHANASDLPWRRDPDPYAVLVSEFMLQQTQRERAAPKFLEFMTRFPTLQTLAGASAAAVIRAWAGLGYNSRALRLHRIARELVHACREIPCDVEALRRLPGIGEYTAGAVACYGFGQPVSFVDTNIRRVLRRAFCGEPFPEPRVKQDRWLAEAALLRTDPMAWNSALMDLGDSVCKAAIPRCNACPLQVHCCARPAFLTFNSSRPRVAAERRARYRIPGPARERFEASNRFIRGRIIDVLRQIPEHAALDGPALAIAASGKGFPMDEGRILRLAVRLVNEGMLVSGQAKDGVLYFRLPD